MTARYWEAFTVVLPEPSQIFGQGIDVVNSRLSFRIGDASISTLSSRGAFGSNTMVRGLFYVPDLNATDPCAELSSQFLPANVTRKATVPNPGEYPLVGVAPWLSDHPECALPYMRATQADLGRALLFFPTRLDADITAPVSDSPDWGVSSKTWSEYVSGTEYPIWAIPSDVGARLVKEMGTYSGNVSTSPFASELNQTYPPENAVRLLANVTLQSKRDTNPVLGRLWVFAIMVLAILCIVTGLVSIIMHFNQRRMRRDLRRRIANGEVDLEALGIQRQKVPQKLLDKMPLYVYTSKMAPLTSPDVREPPSSPQNFSSIQRKNLPRRNVPFSQATCPICLDDFEHNDTIVRELPCQHIFHPECVDDFLRINSSLCPMCKKSALPTGYCPEEITASMVRRERMMRRLPASGRFGPTTLSSVLPASVQRVLPSWLLRLRVRPGHGAEGSRHRTEQPADLPQQTTTAVTHPQVPPPSMATPADLEMGTLHPVDPHPQGLDGLPPEIQALSPDERREWGRQRLAATLPPVQPLAEEEAAQVQHMSHLKRVWKKIFPS